MTTEEIHRKCGYMDGDFQVLKERSRAAKVDDGLNHLAGRRRDPHRPHPFEVRDDQFQRRTAGGNGGCFHG